MAVFQVLVKVTLLSKGQLASSGVSERTCERLLSSMNSEVIIKVMPLSEIHATTRVLALQQLEVAMCLWVFELINSKVRSVGHMLRMQEARRCLIFVKTFTRNYFYFSHMFRDKFQ